MESFIPELRRLLWRYKAGYFVSALVRDRFEEAMRGLQMVYQRLHQEAEHMASSAWESNVASFDSALTNANLALRQNDFDESLKRLEVAARVMDEMEIAGEAGKQLRDAAEVLSAMQKEIQDSLSVIGYFENFLLCARRSFEAGQYRVVRILGTHCLDEIENLMASSLADPNTAAGLLATAERINRTCDRIQQLVSQADAVTRTRGLVILAEDLVKKCKYRLASLVLEEAEDGVSAPGTFFRILDRWDLPHTSKKQSTTVTDTEIELARTGSWIAATDNLLARKLQALAQRLNSKASLEPRAAS